MTGEKIFLLLLISALCLMVWALSRSYYTHKYRTTPSSAPAYNPLWVPVDQEVNNSKHDKDPLLHGLGLLRLTEEEVLKYYGGQPGVGIYSIRYCHIMMCDWNGSVYVGLKTTHLLRLLKAGGFVATSYYVPLGGPGELKNAPTRMVGGTEFVIYPHPLVNLEPDHPRWVKWEALEKEYQRQLQQAALA